LFLLILLLLGQINLLLLHLVEVKQTPEVCCLSGGLCRGRLEGAEAFLLTELL
jgi:hypothetical protein